VVLFHILITLCAKLFAHRFSAKATSDENLIERVDFQLDIADGVAGFGWIGSTNKTMATDQDIMRLLLAALPRGWC
jgi:hypothetical protein